MSWVLIILLILIVLAILVVLALACIAVVLIAIRLLTKKEKKPQLQLPLPGTNCGQCGLPSCQDFVNQVAVNPGYVRNCPCLTPEVKQQVENKIVCQ